MDSLDKLIEELKKTREELSKNAPNMSMSGGAANMAGAGAMKSEGRKDIGDGRTVQGEAPAPEAVESCLEDTIMHGIKKQESPSPKGVEAKVEDTIMSGLDKCGMVKKGDEYFSLFKNGQWQVEKSAKVMPLTPELKSSPKAEPKGKPYDGSQDKKNL